MPTKGARNGLCCTGLNRFKRKQRKKQDVCLWGEEPVRAVARSWLRLQGHDLNFYLKRGKRVNYFPNLIKSVLVSLRSRIGQDFAFSPQGKQHPDVSTALGHRSCSDSEERAAPHGSAPQGGRNDAILRTMLFLWSFSSGLLLRVFQPLPTSRSFRELPTLLSSLT